MSADKHTRPLLALRALKLLVARPHSRDELGAALGLSKSSVVRLMAALSADGVEVKRETNTEDARHVHLSVSRAEAMKALGLPPGNEDPDTRAAILKEAEKEAWVIAKKHRANEERDKALGAGEVAEELLYMQMPDWKPRR